MLLKLIPLRIFDTLEDIYVTKNFDTSKIDTFENFDTLENIYVAENSNTSGNASENIYVTENSDASEISDTSEKYFFEFLINLIF